MKQTIKLTESDLRKMVKVILNEAVDYGWEVDENDAIEAYEFACDRMGKENINAQIVDSLGREELAKCLAFIFRVNDFREWDEYKSSKGENIYEEVYNSPIGGGPQGESDNFFGIKGIRIIWHGEWSDPEVEYNGNKVNYYTLENELCERAKGDGVNPHDDNAFKEYVANNADIVKELILVCGNKEDYDELDEAIRKAMYKQTKLNELTHAKVKSAYDKMRDMDQFKRAYELGAKFTKTLYDNHDTNTQIERFVNTIVVLIGQDDYRFYGDGWKDGKMPRFGNIDRRAAVILSKAIADMTGDPNNQWCDKNLYIG